MPKIIENIKSRILIESKEILLKKNYKCLNIREITKKCDIATGTFYNYFSNKDDLVLQILDNDFNKSIELINKMKFTDIPFKEKLRNIYTYFKSFASDYVPLFYELTCIKNFESTREHDFSKLYLSFSELVDVEKNMGHLNPNINSYNFSVFLISNLISLTKSEYIDFDELCSFMNL